MAIYIVESQVEVIKELKDFLRTKYEETFIVNLKSLMIETGPSRIQPNSIFVYKGPFNHPTINEIKGYCQQHQVPLLAIVDKDSFSSVNLLPEQELVIDVVTDPTDAELLLRVHLLLRYQREKHKRIDKERELQRALAHLTEELEFAKEIQQLVLPREFSEPKIRFSAIYEPSAQLSGDLYFWIKISPHEYGFILIDVSGHGIHAALVSMAMRSLFPGLLKRVKEPKKIAQELNQHMLAMFEKFSVHQKYVTSYFTAILMVINTSEKTISYVNAGHQPGFLLENNDIQSLESTMIPIGLIQNPRIAAETINYQTPAKLLLFTDGLTEIPYSIKINRLDKVRKDFLRLSQMEDSLMLEELLHDRKADSNILDDICAVSISLT